MSGYYPKPRSRETLFKQRTEDFHFRNPIGNEFTLRGRCPDLPSGKPGHQVIARGMAAGNPEGRHRTYKKMLGLEQGGPSARKGP